MICRTVFVTLAAVLSICPMLRAAGEVYKNPDAAVEDRVADLLGRLTQDEKLSMLAGASTLSTRAIPRLGLPAWRMSDGPVGTHNYGKSTAYAGGIALVASFDETLMRRVGEALGTDCRARGVNFLLGPAMNLYRSPLDGRNFEYFGEDPILAGRAASNYVKGLQSKGVSATAKHFVANNQEFDRNFISSNVSERALREVYLRPFHDAVVEGGTWAVMSSYNPLNGIYTTANDHLVRDILKGDWKFQGVFMSDWGAVHTAYGPAVAGLDLEMPDPKFFNPNMLLPLIESGKVSQAVIDDKVRRQLRAAFTLGWFERAATDAKLPGDDLKENPATVAVALDEAREGTVLLKNERNVLPLDKSAVKTIAVLGPEADPAVWQGGGSAFTEPFSRVSVVQGLKDKLGPGVKVVRIPWATTAADGVLGQGKPADGWHAAFFANTNLQGDPAASREDAKIDFAPFSPPPGVPTGRLSARWIGTIKPDRTGEFNFAVRSDDGSRVLVDGKAIIDQWADHQATTYTAAVPLEQGKSYRVAVEYYDSGGEAEVRFGFGPVPTLTDEQRQTIASADAAVVCVGFNGPTGTYEGEGSDRPYALPAGQAALIRDAAAANAKTVVVVIAGGSVETDGWIDRVPALLHAWYPGQSGGTAVAEILLGDVNPSGKLPISWERKMADRPEFGHYPTAAAGRVNDYAEGVFVGYRWFDAKKIEPLFPFGFGLSYTTFALSDLSVEPEGDGFVATATVKNTGKRPGAEVVQLYVAPPPGGPDRPIRELKSFGRVTLEPGESKPVVIRFKKQDLAYWDESSNGWKISPGPYQVQVGSSSRDLPLKATILIQ